MILSRRRSGVFLFISAFVLFAYIRMGELPTVDTGQNHQTDATTHVNRPSDNETVDFTSTGTEGYYDLMRRYAKENATKQVVGTKRILFWNEAYGGKTYDIGIGSDVFQKAGCPTWQCETTDVRPERVDQFDAIVFHLRSWSAHDLPAERSPHQRYVFWSRESPAWRYTNTGAMAGFFNWTMTYRWDSDIVHPYGWLEPTGSVPLHPDEATLERLIAQSSAKDRARGKTKLAAWFVSNCASYSGRGEFVEHLQRHVSVDVYGDCGTKICPRKREDECRRMAARKYKFYLSFENSLCQDYITEKFFGMMQHDIVPVVLDPHGHHAKIAPPHSYINAAKFKSVAQLADYLKLLHANDTLYNEYFWWKPHFRVRNSRSDNVLPMCHLCAALHDASLPAKVYDDMTSWWDERATCTSAKFS